MFRFLRNLFPRPPLSPIRPDFVPPLPRPEYLATSFIVLRILPPTNHRPSFADDELVIYTFKQSQNRRIEVRFSARHIDTSINRRYTPTTLWEPSVTLYDTGINKSPTKLVLNGEEKAQLSSALKTVLDIKAKQKQAEREHESQIAALDIVEGFIDPTDNDSV